MRTLLISLGIIIVASIIAFSRNYRIKEVRSTNSQLRSQAEEISELESEIAQLESINIDTNALEKLRSETMELMQLRAEAARFRPVIKELKSELESDLEEEIKQRESALDRAEVAQDYEINWLIDAANSELIDGAMYTISEKISDYIAENEHFPASMEFFRQDLSELNNFIESSKSRGESNVKVMDSVIKQFMPEDFELISPPSNMENWSERTIVLRETNPRELLNGDRERHYGILKSNFRTNSFRPYLFYVETEKVELEDGDFEKWEREFAEENSGD